MPLQCRHSHCFVRHVTCRRICSGESYIVVRRFCDSQRLSESAHDTMSERGLPSDNAFSVRTAALVYGVLLWIYFLTDSAASGIPHHESRRSARAGNVDTEVVHFLPGM